MNNTPRYPGRDTDATATPAGEALISENRHTSHRRRLGLGAALKRRLAARTPRERWLLGAALIASLVGAGYLLANRLLPPLVEYVTAPAAEYSPLLRELPPATPVDAESWQRAAVTHGLALTEVTVNDEVVITRGEAQQPQALVAFARWAAQRGWWAIDWALARSDTGSLQIEASWYYQPQLADIQRETP
ncbi:hypothetical protein [Kushneria aurantia]|uniref:Uncharacterized protein n=1 Tax=Kushneria aurantia TaxID=504092 RepID=A0ABV6G528_9GAMM|nr:hypothetical protein [Kushneria aurantia]